MTESVASVYETGGPRGIDDRRGMVMTPPVAVNVHSGAGW